MGQYDPETLIIWEILETCSRSRTWNHGAPGAYYFDTCFWSSVDFKYDSGAYLAWIFLQIIIVLETKSRLKWHKSNTNSTNSTVLPSEPSVTTKILVDSPSPAAFSADMNNSYAVCGSKSLNVMLWCMSEVPLTSRVVWVNGAMLFWIALWSILNKTKSKILKLWPKRWYCSFYFVVIFCYKKTKQSKTFILYHT